MNIEIVTMTPQWAQAILDQNTHNRPIRKDVIQKYAYDIENNRYKLTHQGIAIGTNGILLDGQHRLLAIVKTGIAIPIALATNCNPDTFAVLDTGITRKSTDVLSMQQVANASMTSAIVRMTIMYYEHFDKIWQGRLRYPSNDDILEYYNNMSENVDFAVQKSRYVKNHFKQLTSASAVGGFTVLALDKGYNKEHIELFVQKLATGMNLEGLCPILKLRTSVFNGLFRTKGATVVQLTLASLIKTFNNWNSNIEVKQFKVPNVPPMPIINPVKNTTSSNFV